MHSTCLQASKGYAVRPYHVRLRPLMSANMQRCVTDWATLPRARDKRSEFVNSAKNAIEQRFATCLFMVLALRSRETGLKPSPLKVR